MNEYVLVFLLIGYIAISIYSISRLFETKEYSLFNKIVLTLVIVSVPYFGSYIVLRFIPDSHPKADEISRLMKNGNFIHLSAVFQPLFGLLFMALIFVVVFWLMYGLAVLFE